MLDQQNNFFLQGNNDFNNRQKSVFNVLDDLTPESTKQRYSREEFKNEESKKVVSCKKQLKHFRGQESIFKIPDVPLKRSFNMQLPDFVKNPHKWKKYRMSDDVMTERCNTDAAMSFLKEIKTRNEPMETDQSPGPIMFNKYVRKEGEKLAVEDECKATFKDTKVVMPEYVVGQKIKKKVTFKKPEAAESSSQAVKLQHLFDEE